MKKLTYKARKEIKMLKKIVSITIMLVLSSAMLAFANRGKPNFSPAIYADGKTWGTKGTTELPAPNDHNRQAFDALYVIINSNNPMGQLPVGEAAPGNPDYNGGRWITYTVEWTEQAFTDYGTVPLLTSEEDILQQEGLGYLIITAGSPGPPTPDYFQCPLLPVKEE
jgi:hypothetical protein